MNYLWLCHNNSYINMNKSAREKEAVLSVFAELARPLMRVAFEYGISASEIAGVVRRTYIQSLEARLEGLDIGAAHNAGDLARGDSILESNTHERPRQLGEHTQDRFLLPGRFVHVYVGVVVT